jgi:hypothetical protein
LKTHETSVRVECVVFHGVRPDLKVEEMLEPARKECCTMTSELEASRSSFRSRIGVWVLGFLGFLVALFPGLSSAVEIEPFRLEEATIPDLQKAMEEGTLTSELLVRYYLNRIAAYEDRGPPSIPSSR